ncbi:TolC family protein [Desulfobotulus sp. H1]|uniref:TolC family protein n=1 Tax=Desulfobotulus pelophilus TaxID=2823377 RepID=A0ABT3NBT6_9BACT|nr:TolC family protein [Desulfobotulus pelophilus]MCW7754930.1 TolC family protein [Desulfobotulus pelophilus]
MLSVRNCTRCLLGLLLLLSSPALAIPTLQLAVLADADTPEIQSFVDQVLRESRILAGQKTDILLAENGFLATGSQATDILAAHNLLEERKDVDLILALGGFCAPVLAERSAFAKPLIAIGIVDARLQKISFSDQGSSGIPHFTYLITPNTLETDIRSFHRMTAFQRLAILVETPILKEDAIREGLDGLALALGADFLYPEATDAARPATIPENADAVILGSLYRHPQAFREEVIQEAIRRKLPLFSLKGESDVLRGALTGRIPDSQRQQMARLMALRIESVLSGGDLSRIPVTIELDTHMYLNLATAKAIDFSPPWNILTEARISVPAPRTAQEFSLTDLLTEALLSHNSILQAEENLQTAKADSRATKAARLPSLGTEIRGQLQDRDHSIGGASETTAEIAASVRQIIFADQIDSAVYTGERKKDQAAARLEQARLDAILDVGSASLELLRSISLLRIREDTAGHTRNNLDIARQRREVGYTGRAEVLRWENALARARQNLLAAGIAVQQAENSLKRRLGWPLDREINIRDTSEQERFFSATGDIPLAKEIRTPKALSRFSLFLEKEAEGLRPEVLVLDAALAASRREERYHRRRPYTPEVAMAAGATHVLDRSGKGSHIPIPSDDCWQVGIQASWTLYSGGEIRASMTAAQAGIRRLELEKEETLRRIREDVRNRLSDVAAAFFDLDFAAQAADAARANLELVQDAYTKGEASIVDLMDARNADIEAREIQAGVHYALLMARLKLQHAAGFYPALSSPQTLEAFLDRYRAYAKGHTP